MLETNSTASTPAPRTRVEEALKKTLEQRLVARAESNATKHTAAIAWVQFSRGKPDMMRASQNMVAELPMSDEAFAKLSERLSK